LIATLDACIPPETQKEIIENAEVIQEELKREKPRKSIIKTFLEKLESIAANYPEAISFAANLAAIAASIATILA